MTKKSAVNKLMQEYRADEKFRAFFERVVDEFIGGGDFLDKSLFEELKIYLNHLR